MRNTDFAAFSDVAVKCK